jgi:hypothetical protein
LFQGFVEFLFDVVLEGVVCMLIVGFHMSTHTVR